jgi:hypothetical protein
VLANKRIGAEYTILNKIDRGSFLQAYRYIMLEIGKASHIIEKNERIAAHSQPFSLVN